MSDALLELKDIRKTYNVGKENELEVLHGISLSIFDGEFTAIVGESGSGKSTLMNIIGVLDQPTSGSYFLNGLDIAHASRNQMSEIRNADIGFVFQSFNLILRSTALKNVELPMLYKGMGQKERTERARHLLELVGMKERMEHDPSELSGGQKQRVAIARALANDPSIILADEPTGALDSATSRIVMDLFHELHEKEHKTIVLITHSNALAEECPRILTLQDGLIVSDRGNAYDA